MDKYDLRLVAELTERQWYFVDDLTEFEYIEDPIQTLIDNLSGYGMLCSVTGELVTIYPKRGSILPKMFIPLTNVVFHLKGAHLHPVAFGPQYLEPAYKPFSEFTKTSTYRLEPILFGSTLWIWNFEGIWRISSRRDPSAQIGSINGRPVAHILEDIISCKSSIFANLDPELCYSILIHDSTVNGLIYPDLNTCIYHICTRDDEGLFVDEPFITDGKDILPQIPEIKYGGYPALNKIFPVIKSKLDLVSAFKTCINDFENKEPMEAPMLGIVMRAREQGGKSRIYKSDLFTICERLFQQKISNLLKAQYQTSLRIDDCQIGLREFLRSTLRDIVSNGIKLGPRSSGLRRSDGKNGHE